jgi:hypothetical protein
MKEEILRNLLESKDRETLGVLLGIDVKIFLKYYSVVITLNLYKNG